MYLVVGLGNPGEEYVGTRHNAGAETVDRFRARFDFPKWSYDKYLHALCSADTFDEAGVMLLFPQTMMNRSGEAVAGLLRRKPDEQWEIVVVHDELDLPVGRLKIAFERGAGGHHGVESIINALGTNRFARVRIGIAPIEATQSSDDASQNEVSVTRGRDFVLSRFEGAEHASMEAAFAKGVDAIVEIVRHGREVAMQHCNVRR